MKLTPGLQMLNQNKGDVLDLRRARALLVHFSVILGIQHHFREQGCLKEDT